MNHRNRALENRDREMKFLGGDNRTDHCFIRIGIGTKCTDTRSVFWDMKFAGTPLRIEIFR